MAKETLKRSYTVPLRPKFANTPRYKRTNKAVRVLREFLSRHMKSDNIKIGPKLNETLWQDGIKNPPGKVKITATKDDTGMVRAELEGVEYVDFKVQEKKADPTTLKEKIEAKLDGDNKKKPVKKEAKKDSEEIEEKAEKPKTENKAETPAKEEVKETAKPAESKETKAE